MEGTRRSKESTRKIFERGVRSEQRTPGYIVREECKRSKLRLKAGKKQQSLKAKWMKG
jgi:hypothetical protein